MIEYNTQDYWVFGLHPFSGVLKHTKEHTVSETGAVSVLRQEVGHIYSVGSIRKS
jgi:hypothetical protein